MELYEETNAKASTGTCSLESLGAPLFTSRSSQIFFWKKNILLKLFNADIDPEMIRNEQINTTETYEKGVSKVKCYGRVEVEGRTGILMERIKGKTLISLAGSKPYLALMIPRLMADLQINLHHTYTTKIRSYKEMVLSALASQPLSFLSEEEKKIAVQNLNALPDGNSILHFDYHPDNIMSDGRDATIIDWMTAARGVPAADVAATLFLLNEGEMIPGLNKTVAAILEALRRIVCKKYFKIYKKKTGMTDAEVAPWRLPFLIVRLGVWNIDSERPALQKKIREELHKHRPGSEKGGKSVEQNKQATAAVVKCAAKLKATGIGGMGSMIALRLDSGNFAVTAPKAGRNGMDQPDILFLDRNGLRLQSKLSYDVFQQNKELRAFICTRPYFCSLAVEKGKDIPPVLDDMAQIVGVYACVCAAEDEPRLLRVLKKHGACLVSGRNTEGASAVAVGRSLDQAFTAILVLEKASQVFLQAELLGGAKPLFAAEAQLMHLVYKFRYSRCAETVRHRAAADFNRAIPQEELALRERIVELGRRLSRENLVQGTWGNVSVRLDEDHMLCTPTGLEYSSLLPYDIVRVELDTLEYEGDVKPTSEKTFHAAILRTHPEVTCIIHSHPVNCSVFAAAHKKISPTDEAQRTLLCGDVEVAKYALPSTKALSRNVVAAIKNNRACVMENHGMLVCGSSIEDAHEKCRVAEECARMTLENLNIRSTA